MTLCTTTRWDRLRFRFFHECSEKRQPSPCKAWTGSEKNGEGLRRQCFDWENERRVVFPMERWWFLRICKPTIVTSTRLRRSMCPTAECCEKEVSRRGSWNGDFSLEDTFCSWEDFRRKRV